MVDLAFNVITRSDGLIIGSSSGHADSARRSIVMTRLTAAGFPKIVSEVTTLTTPSDTVDVPVAEGGIATNPGPGRPCRTAARRGSAGVSIEGLAAKATTAANRTSVARSQGRVVTDWDCRDGSVTDVVREMDEV